MLWLMTQLHTYHWNGHFSSAIIQILQNHILKNCIIVAYTARDPCATSRHTIHNVYVHVQMYYRTGKFVQCNDSVKVCYQANYESPMLSSVLFVATYSSTDGYW